jgi:hypothetical protein
MCSAYPNPTLDSLRVACHNAHTGLAARPSWGPMYGFQQASEQQLAGQALARVPADALVLGDRNFATSAFARTVVGSGRPVLLRLTARLAARGERPTTRWLRASSSLPRIISPTKNLQPEPPLCASVFQTSHVVVKAGRGEQSDPPLIGSGAFGSSPFLLNNLHFFHRLSVAVIR